MGTQERRGRERAAREQLIVTAARELAEREGWEAVTTRRLAELVEYSQPVLYSHFAGKDAIMAAVAVEGFGELAGELHAARSSAPTPLRAAAEAYLAFAAARPALYDAMFSRVSGLPFATDEAPPALHTAFEELRRAANSHATAAAEEAELALTEVLWAGLHGLATLTRGGRLPAERQQQRLELLLRVGASGAA